VVRDDPIHPKALVGGWFDDAGFPTRIRPLADGEGVVDTLDGPGLLRRGSFRDLPEPHPSCLVVAGKDGAYPDPAIHLLDLRIYACPPGSWLLEGAGHVVRRGRSAGVLPRVTIRTSPEKIAAGLVATAGAPVVVGSGVVSPALVVEGLRSEI
jgi:hypothetical protein